MAPPTIPLTEELLASFKGGELEVTTPAGEAFVGEFDKFTLQGELLSVTFPTLNQKVGERLENPKHNYQMNFDLRPKQDGVIVGDTFICTIFTREKLEFRHTRNGS